MEDDCDCRLSVDLKRSNSIVEILRGVVSLYLLNGTRSLSPSPFNRVNGPRLSREFLCRMLFDSFAVFSVSSLGS